MKTALRIVVVVVLIAACIGSESLSADFGGPAGDGWHTWRVAATGKARESCCFTWISGVVTRKGCDLDSEHGNYGSIHSDKASDSDLQIYALMRSGKAVKLRTLSSQCAVTADSEITDLGFIDVDASINWLQRYIEPRSELSSDAIMSISLHSGDLPVTVLASIVKSGTDRKIREEALFWLGQSDSDEAFAVLDRLLSGAM
jgi:hypothetical protein